MASGSSIRGTSASKGFDFGSDDVLCSYEDYGNQEPTNGSHSDAVIGANSTEQDFHKSRMIRSSVLPATCYGQPEDSFPQDVISTAEKSMKKQSENLMRFLEGISSRLSQLELYCYNLDKSIGEMRSDLVRDNGEVESTLKSVEKHLHEVQRSVQILRDKQELADTQKELAQLQLVKKDTSPSSHFQSSEAKVTAPTSDFKKMDNTSEFNNQQLALALPQQVVPQLQPPSVTPPSLAPQQNVAQHQSYYLPPAQLPTPPVPIQHPQGQYLPSDAQYQTPQMQDISRVAPQPAQTQANLTPPVQQFSQYPPKWPQQVQPPQQPLMQPQVRPSSTTAYPTYLPPGQPTNSSASETNPKSMPMQVPYSAVPQPLASRAADTIPYGYGAGRTVPQQPLPPPQQLKGTFGALPGDGYAPAGTHPALPPGSAYMMYNSESGRIHHPPHQPHFPQGGYPLSNLPLQSSQSATAGANMLARNPGHSQFNRNHPYSDLIEKLVGMGFRVDHVFGVIQRMEDSGHPVDFNAVLDRLNVHSSGAPQRGW
uniref:Trithorax group protein osa isoform X1 n=1 Tax=Rhizophora mucronata TaxID=61149 RepID=A0A2P2K524_RHIMU